MSEKPKWLFRLAMPEDAEAFSKWVTDNPLIDPQDVQDGLNKNNPTTLTFVACLDGKPVLFAPLFLVARLAHLGFEPLCSGKERMRALEVIKDGIMAFMVQYGIREIETLSKPEYGVAKWAMRHDFEQDTRSVFRLNLNREMAR